MRLDAGHKDWQLPALAAPPSCDSHAKRLEGFLLHSDVLLFTGHTLGKVLGLKTQEKSSVSLYTFTVIHLYFPFFARE